MSSSVYRRPHDGVHCKKASEILLCTFYWFPKINELAPFFNGTRIRARRLCSFRMGVKLVQNRAGPLPEVCSIFDGTPRRSFSSRNGILLSPNNFLVFVILLWIWYECVFSQSKASNETKPNNLRCMDSNLAKKAYDNDVVF